MSHGSPTIAVVGSINVDLTARVASLPRRGESLMASSLSEGGGGKGANQALAAARLGATVRLVGCVGDDARAAVAIGGLTEAGVDVSAVRVARGVTGTALIVVDDAGENQIVVAPGANALLAPDDLPRLDGDAVLCQLESPVDTVLAAARRCDGLFVLNASPAKADLPRELVRRCDLLVVNQHEAAFLADVRADALVATTAGEGPVELARGGEVVARHQPVAIEAVDGTAAGDAFCAALVVALLEGVAEEPALAWASAAGAHAAARAGAQSSLPWRADLPALPERVG